MSQTDATALRSLAPTTAAAYRSDSFARAAWGRFLRDRFAVAALVIFVLIAAISFTAPLITANILHSDPNRGRLTQKFRSPDREHPLGTDDFGRDQLARLLHAGQVSLSIGFLSAFVSLAIGVSLGMLAAYYGRWVDDAINALVQMFNNIPTLFLLILLSIIFRPSVVGLAFLIGLTGWTGTTRQVRARVLSERRRDYVDAAIVMGARTRRIVYRHILPNVSSLVLVFAGFDIIGAIISEAGISYLGFGVQIPTASWGNMLSKSFDYFTIAPWLIIAPGVIVVLTELCLFQLTDGLRDALDPRLKS